nr:ribonuclease H-like domain-containing protein [Tanacetum cinerariifolium]
MDQQYPTVAKIPMLDTGKFKQWQFRMQQYLQHEHYALWEVIEYGDSYTAPENSASTTTTSTTSGDKSGRTVTLTTEDMQKKKNDVKSRTTLLLSLPDKHQLRFSKHKTAKELWAAILKTFGGNEATKKTKKNLLKQQSSEEIGAKHSEHGLYLFNKHSRGNDEVNTASVYTGSSNVPTASANVATVSISQDTACAYIASQSGGSQIKFEDINQINEDDMEEMDIKWNMALLSMRADKFVENSKIGSSKMINTLINAILFVYELCTKLNQDHLLRLSDASLRTYRRFRSKTLRKCKDRPCGKNFGARIVLVRKYLGNPLFTRDNNCTIEFDTFEFSVKCFLTRHILLRCDLYLVTQPSSLPSALMSLSSSTWHQRLGHPGDEVLRSLTSRSFISCNKEKSPHVCHACQLGKHVQLPFSSSTSIVSSCFEIIHSDIWTSPIVSTGGFRYYVIFLDHFSQYLWIYPLRTKSEVFAKFVHFRSYVKNQFKCEILGFQCDHGGEFDNTQLLDLFSTHEIQMRFSCPKTSQQNGKSKRMIRTINNMIRMLLFQAHLLPTFWVEALHMAAYLLNLLPSTAIPNEIPLTKLFNKQPNYSELRTFGCLCYPHHKLAPRATPCIFLGYPAYHQETVYMHQPPGFVDPRYPHNKRYAMELLERAHMLNCNPTRTPVDTESKLGPERTPISDHTLYQSLAGGLQAHLAALKRILRYVQGTLEFGLQLYASSESSLVAFSDADWAGCPATRISTSGAEAEYRGVANVVAETAWLQNLLPELHTPLMTATLVYCDNVSVVYLSANPVQ